MTNFDTIEDMALIIIDDYKMMKAYQSDVESFKEYLDGFLIQATMQFYQCRQDLTYDSTERYFNADLTTLEQSILADFFVINWWRRETNNAAQIALKLKVSTAFTFNSESQNFKEKQTIIDKLEEQVNLKITEYMLQELSNYDY